MTSSSNDHKEGCGPAVFWVGTAAQDLTAEGLTGANLVPQFRHSVKEGRGGLPHVSMLCGKGHVTNEDHSTS